MTAPTTFERLVYFNPEGLGRGLEPRRRRSGRTGSDQGLSEGEEEMTDDSLIKLLRDVLTIRQLSHETHVQAEQMKAIDALTEHYLEEMLKPFMLKEEKPKEDFIY